MSQYHHVMSVSQKLIIVAGMAGTGKTSIIRGVSGAEEFRGVKVLNFGDLFLKAYRDEGGSADNKDQLRLLQRRDHDRIAEKVWTGISNEEGNVILDTHAFVEREGRLVGGLPADVMLRFRSNIGAFVYIDSDDGVLLRRLEADTTRNRERPTEQELSYHKAADIAVLANYSACFGVPLCVIVNKEGQLRASVERLKDHLRDIFGAAQVDEERQKATAKDTM